MKSRKRLNRYHVRFCLLNGERQKRIVLVNTRAMALLVVAREIAKLRLPVVQVGIMQKGKRYPEKQIAPTPTPIPPETQPVTNDTDIT